MPLQRRPERPGRQRKKEGVRVHGRENERERKEREQKDAVGGDRFADKAPRDSKDRDRAGAGGDHRNEHSRDDRRPQHFCNPAHDERVQREEG